MLFENQTLKRGILIDGEINPSGANNSNVVLASGAFTGAYLNKEIFAQETMDVPNLELKEDIDKKKDEIIDLLKKIGITNSNFKHLSTSSQHELIDSPEKLAQVIRRIKNAPSKFAKDVCEYKDSYKRKHGICDDEIIQEQAKAYQAQNIKQCHNKYINGNTSNAEFYTPNQIKEDAIHREKLIKTAKKAHQEFLMKSKNVKMKKKQLKEYDISISSNKKLFDSYIEGFTDVYNKDLKVENHISEELIGNILTRLAHIGKDMFLEAHEVSSTISDPTDIRTDSIEFMAKRVGSVMWEKYVYELNSHINSIYEKNSVDGKIVRKDNIVDSFEFVENPVLRNAIESRIPTFDLVNLENGMKEIERNEYGKFKLSKGYHKILNIDTESLITVIYEWTGKHPSLNIFIPDSFFMKMVSMDGTKERYKLMLDELNAEIDQLNETAPYLNIFDDVDDETDGKQILLDHVTFIKKDDTNDNTLKSWEKEYMVHESFDRRLLKNAYEKQSEKMIRETVFGDDQFYKKGLEKVKKYFHAVMIDHNIRLKEETGFFINPFHVDENNKSLELKETVAFMSSSSYKHIKFNQKYRDTTMGIILGINSLIDPSFQPDITNILGLNYGVRIRKKNSTRK